jgi:hypothetical protein
MEGEEEAMRRLLLFALLSRPAFADIACIGFTAPECDRSYPATERGMKCAVEEMPPKGMTMKLGPVIIFTWGDFCSDQEWRDYLKNGENFLPTKAADLWLNPFLQPANAGLEGVEGSQLSKGAD